MAFNLASKVMRKKVLLSLSTLVFFVPLKNLLLGILKYIKVKKKFNEI